LFRSQPAGLSQQLWRLSRLLLDDLGQIHGHASGQRDPFVRILTQKFSHPFYTVGRWRQQFPLLDLRQVGRTDTDQFGELAKAVSSLAFFTQELPEMCWLLTHTTTVSVS